MHLWHWSQTQFQEGHSSAQFTSNPNQTHLIQIIQIFRITRNLQACVVWSWLELNSAELWPSRNWAWDHWSMVLCECLRIILVIVYCTVFQLVLIFLLFCSLSVFSRSSLQRHKYIAATFPLSERQIERAQTHLSTIVQLVLSDTLHFLSFPFLPLRVLFLLSLGFWFTCFLVVSG